MIKKEDILMAEQNRSPASWGSLPSLNDEALNRLADLVVSRLTEQKLWRLPSQGRDHGFESRMRYQFPYSFRNIDSSLLASQH